MNQDIASAQDNLVYSLIDVPNEAWEQIIVNYEIDFLDEGHIINYIAFYVTKYLEDEFIKHSIGVLSTEINECFLQLNYLMSKLHPDRWRTCNLVIDKSGKYNMNLSYDPPKRINCIFDDESMGRFDRYVATYKAERQKL